MPFDRHNTILYFCAMPGINASNAHIMSTILVFMVTFLFSLVNIIHIVFTVPFGGKSSYFFSFCKTFLTKSDKNSQK